MTPAEYTQMRRDLQELIAPFAARKFEFLSSAPPIMTITRTDDGWIYTASYPDDVQRSLEEIDAMWKQTVGDYLRSNGLVAETGTSTDQQKSAPRNDRFAFRGAQDFTMPSRGGEVSHLSVQGGAKSPESSHCLYGFVYGK
ncbi:hypothetical protein V2J83_11800 [Pseudomonas alliivorans]|nr:hypothetical protein [Pseudomonas alliivorans]